MLGDTSYGECCVDEVAAQHLNADAVIHFGHTCLTPSQVDILKVMNREIFFFFTKGGGRRNKKLSTGMPPSPSSFDNFNPKLHFYLYFNDAK